MQTVASYHDPIEAQIVRALLEGSGIEATVADLNLVTANWPMSVALGGVRVQVRQDDLEEARRLVDAYHAGELAQPDDEPQAESCASCGASGLKTFVPVSQKVLALAAFAWAGASISTRAGRVCGQCGAVESRD